MERYVIQRTDGTWFTGHSLTTASWTFERDRTKAVEGERSMMLTTARAMRKAGLNVMTKNA